MIGGVFGPHLKPRYRELSSHRVLASFILVVDPAVFGSADGYLERTRTQRMIDERHRHPPAPGVARVLWNDGCRDPGRPVERATWPRKTRIIPLDVPFGRC